MVVIAGLSFFGAASSAFAGQGVKFLIWNADLSRDGPGLLLRDIIAGEAAVTSVIDGLVAQRPDVVLLSRIDIDLHQVTLRALQRKLSEAGLDYPYLYAPPQNRGVPSGIDLDGDGKFGTAEDAQGYGRFSGDGAMALLSRYPVTVLADLSGFLWRDLPGARLEAVPKAARAVQRLPSSGLWHLRVEAPSGGIGVISWAASPPIFGHGTRNRDRNHDETALVVAWLAGKLPVAPPKAPFVMLAHPNLGPAQGDGAAVAALRSHPLIWQRVEGVTATLATGPVQLAELLVSTGLGIARSGQISGAAARHNGLWAQVFLP